MNLLGRRSLPSFFKVLLDIAFYAAEQAAAADGAGAKIVTRRG